MLEDLQKKAADLLHSEKAQAVVEKAKDVINSDKGKEALDKGKEVLEKGKETMANAKDKFEDFVEDKTNGKGIFGFGKKD